MASHVVLCVLLAVFQSALASNILFLSGVPSPSHHLYNRVLAGALGAKGHNVTFVSADVSPKALPNVHYIHLERTYEAFYVGEDAQDILMMAEQTPAASVRELPQFFKASCHGNLASEGLDVIVNYPNDFKFDVVINDFTFGPCLLPLIAKFNFPPLVSISAFANPPYTTDYVGGQKYPAYIPHYAVDYSTDMTFAQRVFNTYLYFLDWMSHEFVLYPHIEEMTREKFKFEFPPIKELSRKTAIILVNSDNAIDLPEPLQPNMIQVGGLQIVDAKPLSEEMENFIGRGKKGTVLMSLGTNMKSNMLGDERLKIILNTFAQISDYNFLWKFESEAKDLPITPSANVMVGKFLPQNDILTHPHVKAFISHAGLLSTHETLWHGKPMIGMPIFVDQKRNAGKCIALGLGVRVNFRDLSVETFKAKILEILDNPKYFKNAQKVSKLFKDKPEKPLNVAVWWVEYAIRNPNLENLRSPTLQLGPFASKSYDVLLAVIALLHVVAFAVIKILKRVLRVRKGKKKTD